MAEVGGGDWWWRLVVDLEKLIGKIIDWSDLDEDTKQKEKHATLEAWKAGTPSVRTRFIWGEI